MNKNFIKTILLSSIAFATIFKAKGEDPVYVMTSAVPFLTITPESRGGGMGDVGAATKPDVYSQHWNPAKYAFSTQDFGVSTSYTPWLRSLGISDINLFYLTGFKKIDKMQSVSASLRYFSLGEITFKTNASDPGTTGKPNEFAFDLAYSRILTKTISGGVAFRYIRSDITNGVTSATGENSGLHAGNAFAADVAFYYLQPVKWVGQKGSTISAGVALSNYGSKITYDDVNKEPLPTNLKLGVGMGIEVDKYNTVNIAVDANKLLVQYDETDDESNTDSDGEYTSDPLTASLSMGLEYWYAKQFAVRGGYFFEPPVYGNRRYATIGAGLKFNIFSIDASYIISTTPNNPLANTIRFSLGFDLSKKKTKKS